MVGTQLDNEKVFIRRWQRQSTDFKEEIDLLKADCYILPKFTKESPEVAAACGNDEWVSGASVTYDFNRHTELVGNPLISQWVKVDADECHL